MAQVELGALAAPGMAQWLLVRSPPPRGTGLLHLLRPVSTSLVGLVLVAGMR